MRGHGASYCRLLCHAENLASHGDPTVLRSDGSLRRRGDILPKRGNSEILWDASWCLRCLKCLRMTRFVGTTRSPYD